jgi:hypothetical protein
LQSLHQLVPYIVMVMPNSVRAERGVRTRRPTGRTASTLPV